MSKSLPNFNSYITHAQWIGKRKVRFSPLNRINVDVEIHYFVQIEKKKKTHTHAHEYTDKSKFETIFLLFDDRNKTVEWMSAKRRYQ